MGKADIYYNVVLAPSVLEYGRFLFQYRPTQGYRLYLQGFHDQSRLAEDIIILLYYVFRGNPDQNQAVFLPVLYNLPIIINIPRRKRDVFFHFRFDYILQFIGGILDPDQFNKSLALRKRGHYSIGIGFA